MPKQTFFNLPEEKQTKIIEIAIDEFAANTFKNASITKIAEGSGIAKGSIYQYFEDKKELYKYMLELAGKKKLEYLLDCMQQLNNLSFFDLIKELYVKGIQFAHDNPKLAAVANNFIKEIDIKLKEEIMGSNLEKSNLFFEQLIDSAKAKGEISQEVDTKIGAYMITTLNTALVDYVINSSRVNNIFSLTDEILQSVDKMFYVLKNGFKKR